MLAWHPLLKKGESWYCQFLYHAKRHTFTIGKVEPDEAESQVNQVDYLRMRIRQGPLAVPPEPDIVLFLQHDGKPPEARLPAATAPLGCRGVAQPGESAFRACNSAL